MNNKFAKALPTILSAVVLLAPLLGPTVQDVIAVYLTAHPVASTMAAALSVILANFWPQPHKS